MKRIKSHMNITFAQYKSTTIFYQKRWIGGSNVKNLDRICSQFEGKGKFDASSMCLIKMNKIYIYFYKSLSYGF